MNSFDNDDRYGSCRANRRRRFKPSLVDLLPSEPLPNNGKGMTLHLGGGRWLRFGDYQNVKMTVMDGSRYS